MIKYPGIGADSSCCPCCFRKRTWLNDGENAIGKIVAALRRMGFDDIFDTSTGADLTVLEESQNC